MKINRFLKFLNTTSLTDEDKKTIKFMIDFLYGKNNPKLSNKSFLFSGEQGIGKTYLIDKLIENIDLPVLFLGPYSFKDKKVKKVNSLNEIINNLDKFKQGIIFIDDIKYVLGFNDEDDITDKEEKRLMKLLEYLKRTNKRIVLIMTLNNFDYIDDSCLDRIEVKINFNFPNEENKLSFLKENFKEYSKISELKYIANNSFGYNYRDLPELIKIAYREGDKKINKDSIKKALCLYNPSNLSRLNVEREVKIKFNDVVGNNNIKKELNKLKIYIKNKKRLEELGIKKSNLIVFSGPPGTGKTFMATALAGELDLPIIKINAMLMYMNNPINSISNIIGIVKRFRNCVVFIDDVDKLIGRDPLAFDEEGPVLAELATDVDDTKGVEGIIILAVNNISRMGMALQNRFSIIEFKKPDFEERENFIKRLILKSKLKENIKSTDLARMTSNMSYRDIQRLWNECVFYYIQNKKMDYNVIKEIFYYRNNDPDKVTMFG